MKYPIARSPLLETAQVRGDWTETSLERKICSGGGSWSGNSEGYSQHWMSYWCQNANTGIYCWVT